MKKIKYVCKPCGWSTSIIEDWSDLKPQRCMNKKCGTSFRTNKEALEIIMPSEETQENKPETKSNAKTKQSRKESSQAE